VTEPDALANVSFGEFPFDLPPETLRTRGLAAIGEAEARLETLLASHPPPTVDGLLAPLDAILSDIFDVSQHGGFAFQVHSDAATRAAGREVSEAADQFFNRFRVERRAYDLLRSIPADSVDRPTAFAVEKLLRDMRRAGVEHDAAGRARLLALQNEIDQVSNQFSENIAAGEREVLALPTELTGVPADYLASHPPGADGRVRVSTRGPDMRPVMAYADSDALRRSLFREFMNRGHPANGPVLTHLLDRRHELARALGYPTFAAYALEDKMLKDPAAAQRFLDTVAGILRPPAQQEIARYLARKRQDVPKAETIELWDVGGLGEGYYDGKIRREQFGVDSKLLREHLPYGQVRDGLFALCEELFGLTFAQVHPEGLWHSSVEAFDVRRRGAPVGRFYLDLVPREGKFTHAACFTVRAGTAPRQLPQSALVCNFLDSTVERSSARMQHADVVTFFHEFGHLLHSLLSGHGRWLYNTMAFVEWDFVESPSLLFEEWARDPATLGRFARDPKTGEAVPEELLRRLVASDGLGRASTWLRQVALASTSLRLYDRDPAGLDPTAEYVSTFGRYWPIPFRDDYHPTDSWGHLTGYSAFYYTYVWSLAIARDLLSPFLVRGSLTDPELAARYAKEILEPGSARPATELVEAYLGRPIHLDSFRAWIESGAAAMGSVGAGGPLPRAPASGAATSASAPRA
jgi:thimet oligopeptidase